MGAKWNQKILSPIANCNDKAGLLGLEKVRSPDGGGRGFLGSFGGTVIGRETNHARLHMLRCTNRQGLFSTL
jgi:hypothetical protein